MFIYHYISGRGMSIYNEKVYHQMGRDVYVSPKLLYHREPDKTVIHMYIYIS